MEDDVVVEPPAPRNVIYIKDGDEPLPLYRVVIDGIEFHTTDEKTTRELRERFKRMVALPDPRRRWYNCLLDWIL